MPKGLFLILLILFFNLAYTQEVVINEIMSANGNTIMDDFGDYSDWVELYNSSSETISVYQWCLSDDENELDKWQFPDTTIFPNSF